MADAPRRLYWDSCVWIGLINEEEDKHGDINAVWEAAERGLYELWTSAYVHIEVVKAVAQGGDPYQPEESDRRIDAVLEQPHVIRVQVDVVIAKLARDLRRMHPGFLKKKADAIHLATACYHNVEALHTYDGSDLLPLNGNVSRRDGQPLRICLPDPLHGAPLFDAATEPASEAMIDDEAENGQTPE